MNIIKWLQGRLTPVWLMMVLAVAISFITRLVLLLASKHTGIDLAQIFGLFGIGFLYDLGVAGVVVLLLLVQLRFQNNFIYRKKVVSWVIAAFALLPGLLIFTNIIPKDYNRQVHQTLVMYIAVRCAIYLLPAFLPYRFRIA